MENQHRHLFGCRDLVAAEVSLINEIKAHGAVLADLLVRIEDARFYDDSDDDEAVARPAGYADRRWLAIGRTHLQEGLMALERAVARPEGF